ncbi:MAG TPA: hypothetical protein VMH87_17695 [Pseudomonadales bacterium]|nr:hypothetical protein [Pseudomonadales bacterium]
MKDKLLYLDHNAAIHVLKRRRPDFATAIEEFRGRGGKIVYSPAHIEEIANIYRTKATDADCDIYVHNHLRFFANLTDCWEFLPSVSGPIILKREHPSVCLKRVIDLYELTFFAEGNENALRDSHPPSRSPPPSIDVFEDPEVLRIFKFELAVRGFEISEIPYGPKIRESYAIASKLVDIGFRSIRCAGFGREKKSETRSSIHDTTHAGFGIMANVFVSGDNRLLAMVKACYKMLKADCLPMSPEEFVSEIKRQPGQK